MNTQVSEEHSEWCSIKTHLEKFIQDALDDSSVYLITEYSSKDVQKGLFIARRPDLGEVRWRDLQQQELKYALHWVQQAGVWAVSSRMRVRCKNYPYKEFCCEYLDAEPLTSEEQDHE